MLPAGPASASAAQGVSVPDMSLLGGGLERSLPTSCLGSAGGIRMWPWVMELVDWDTVPAQEDQS